MAPQSLCWMNGSIQPTADARISVLDHGLLYGDGVFEGMRFYNNQVLHLDLHLERLAFSAAALQLELPYSPADITAALERLIHAYAVDRGYIRLVVTRGAGNLGLNPRHCLQAGMFIIADQLSLASAEALAAGLTLITSSVRRIPGNGLDPRVKSLNYLPSVLARIEANQSGADEALLLNDRGFIAEATAENLFIERNGGLLTPPCTDGALGGITRRTVIDLARALAIEVRECSLTPYDVYTADGCFLTGSGAGLLPVRELDGRPVGRKVGKLVGGQIEGQTGTKSGQKTESLSDSSATPGGSLFSRLQEAFTHYVEQACHTESFRG